MTLHLKKHRGFSLIEMAIVLVILGLLLSGGLSVLSTQLEQQRIQEAQRTLNDARDALIGFAIAAQPNPHLPCPDKTGAAGVGVANDGQEDRNVALGPLQGTCVNTDGNLPWVTLGVAASDPWGNRLRYSVTPAFAQTAPAAILAVNSTGNRTIINALGPIPPLAQNIPAVILSHGRNGFGAQNSNGGANAAVPGANQSEADNADGDIIPAINFVSNPPVGAGGTGGEFDDLVIWIPTGILMNRLIQAGRLP